jgi:hypothetical protein
MVFMQRWLMCLLPAFVFQFSFISLTKTDRTGNATTDSNTFKVVGNFLFDTNQTSRCMKKVLLLISILFVGFVGFSQKKFNPVPVEKLLSRFVVKGGSDNEAELIEKIIGLIDKDYNKIVDTLFPFRQHTHTILQGRTIEIRQLLNAQEAYSSLISKNQAGAVPDLVKDFSGDTAAFINKFNDNSFPDIFPKGLYPIVIKTISINSDPNGKPFSHIAFDVVVLNKLLKRLSAKLTLKQRAQLDNYLDLNWDHYSRKEKKLMAQPVRFQYILFDRSQQVHAGIDVYGAHYLWTIDMSGDWKIVAVKELWIY